MEPYNLTVVQSSVRPVVKADGRFRPRLAAGDVVGGAPENLLAVSALRTWLRCHFSASPVGAVRARTD